MQTPCNTCGGQGVSVPPNSDCWTCNGQGRVKQKKDLLVTIPPGVEDGMKIRLARQGDAGVDSAADGDLFVRLNVATHPIFKRTGPDVSMNVNVPLPVALLGVRTLFSFLSLIGMYINLNSGHDSQGSIRVPTLEGEVDLMVPAGTQPNEKKVLRGRGVRRMGSFGDSKGDMWVEFKVDVPKRLDERQRRLVEEAFGVTGASSGSSTTTGSSSTGGSSSSASASTLRRGFHSRDDPATAKHPPSTASSTASSSSPSKSTPKPNPTPDTSTSQTPTPSELNKEKVDQPYSMFGYLKDKLKGK